MTEEEARVWLDELGVSRETFRQIERFVALLLKETSNQNLISASTKNNIWARHIVDSAQLLTHSPPLDEDKMWVDTGSGAGLPGIVLAILSDWKILLIDSRRKRVEFLQSVVKDLGLKNVSVRLGQVQHQNLAQPAAVISARAFAPLPKLFSLARHLGDARTVWLLPKGKNWKSDLDDASMEWQGRFHVEQSITDPDSAIIVASSVRRNTKQ